MIVCGLTLNMLSAVGSFLQNQKMPECVVDYG